MVDGQVRTADVTDLRILAAMSEMPRERFLPPALAGLAYLDLDVPVSATRRLLKPMVFAKLDAGARLERRPSACSMSAAAAGYGAAVLARLAGHVVALEEDASLAAIRASRARRCAECHRGRRPASGGLAAGRALRRHPAGRRGRASSAPLCSTSSKTAAGSPACWAAVRRPRRRFTAAAAPMSAAGRSSMPPPRFCPASSSRRPSLSDQPPQSVAEKPQAPGYPQRCLRQGFYPAPRKLMVPDPHGFGRRIAVSVAPVG